MKKFPLQDIELFVADAILEKAEFLLEGQSIHQFQELERNLWVALINGKESYEVEVQISPSKVKAYTCDCGNQASDPCEHVAAIMLLLRQKMNARKEKIKKAKEPKSKAQSRVTTSTILDLVRPNELKAFIKKYAAQDRTFTLMLKAQFAHIVPGNEEKEHINKVLENTIKSVKRPGKAINTSGVKLIQRVVNTIQQQSEEALSKKHFADVFESLNAIIIQLIPISGSIKNDQTFSKLISHSYLILQRLVKNNLPPQLENEIWHFLLTESQRATYYTNEIWSELLELILYLSNTKPRQDAFAKILEELEAERFVQNNTAIRSGILSTKMSLLNIQGNQAALEFFLKHNLNDKEVLLNALKLNAQKEDWNKVKQLANYALEKQLPELEDDLLFEFLLRAALHKKEKRNILKYGTLRFYKSYDFKYFELIKANASKKWLSLRSELLNNMKQKPYSIENRNCMAKIYANEKLYPELFDFIKNTKSLDLLKKYDGLLQMEFLEQIPVIYKSLINDYLNNYLGRQAALKIRKSIEHLIANDQNKLAGSLVRDIRSKYKERHALMEELAHF